MQPEHAFHIQSNQSWGPAPPLVLPGPVLTITGVSSHATRRWHQWRSHSPAPHSLQKLLNLTRSLLPASFLSPSETMIRVFVCTSLPLPDHPWCGPVCPQEAWYSRFFWGLSYMQAILPTLWPSDLLIRTYFKCSRNKPISAKWKEFAELQTQLKLHTLGNSVLAQEIMLVSVHWQL